jgi:hypothetical protein
MVSFRIQAHLLRRWISADPKNTVEAEALAADEPTACADTDSSEAKDANLERAIEIAKEAGLENYRVELSPDGKVTIIVGPPPGCDEPSPEYPPIPCQSA